MHGVKSKVLRFVPETLNVKFNRDGGDPMSGSSLLDNAGDKTGWSQPSPHKRKDAWQQGCWAYAVDEVLRTDGEHYAQ